VRISRNLVLCVIAAEDQKFAAHNGFDVDAIARAVEEKRARPRGASTISQQLAKNLFLWPGRSFVRKGLEAYFTVWLEQTWPKRSILEVYLNVAEFGPGVFGAQAASELIFNKSASQLASRRRAPRRGAANPKRCRRRILRLRDGASSDRGRRAAPRHALRRGDLSARARQADVAPDATGAPASTQSRKPPPTRSRSRNHLARRGGERESSEPQ
jgi:monofunctional biosynthetic peptidoglycan transglycosylase